jgi:hypothetical protein
VISSPDLLALYDEDLTDAALHTGITLLRDDYFQRQHKHLYSAFISYGLNNASHIPGPGTTTNNSYSALRRLLSVHLTAEALEVDCAIKWTNRTCLLSWAQHRGYFSAELGLRWEEDPDYRNLPWEHRTKALVQECVLNEIQNHYHNSGDSNITDVLLMGEMGGIPPLRSTVISALEEIQVQYPECARRG